MQDDTKLTKGLLSLEEYKHAHPGKALLGLNGIMTSPRFFTFVLWLTKSDFRLSRVKHVLLVKAETAVLPVRVAMQILRCPFFGIMLSLFMPGIQVRPQHFW